MSDPRCIFCRDCNDSAWGPCGTFEEEIQKWFEIRYPLAEVRDLWPGWTNSPSLDSENDSELTMFLCKHKDHDIAMKDALGRVTEFNRSKEKAKIPDRYLRELVSNNGFKSDIIEVDPGPILQYQVLKRNNSLRGCYSRVEPAVGTSPELDTMRFVFEKEELVILRTYKEK